MNISEIAKHVKAKDKKPKLIKPNKGHESPHPLKGKLVGEADQPKDDVSARNKLDHSLRAQGHKVEKDKKKKLKKGEVKHKGKLYDDLIALEDKKKTKKDACYHKVKSRYKVWPSAYASGALVQCRKKGAKNWGNSSKK